MLRELHARGGQPATHDHPLWPHRVLHLHQQTRLPARHDVPHLQEKVPLQVRKKIVPLQVRKNSAPPGQKNSAPPGQKK